MKYEILSAFYLYINYILNLIRDTYEHRVDIDGVLTDLERMALDFGTKMCVEENIPIELNLSKYWEIEKYNWTKEQEELFWNKNLVPYVVESNPRKFAPQILEKLQEEGNKIFIITARNESGMPPEYEGKMQELTKKWLLDNNIKYKKLIFTDDTNKLKNCIENNIDVMVEDSPINIKNISQKIKVIKFDCQYNKDIDGKNILTAYSWYHIYDIIRKLNTR